MPPFDQANNNNKGSKTRKNYFRSRKNYFCSNMNKHTLDYHTRLHDWYRQHTILQDKHHSNINDDLAPRIMDGLENLTNDKLRFILDWCSDVNSAFFKVASKESQPTARFNEQVNTTASKGRSKSTNLQPVSSSGVPKLVGQRGMQPKTCTKGVRLQAHGITKSQNVSRGGQNKGNGAGRKKLMRTVKDVGHLDLCIRNSKSDVIQNRETSQVTRDSSNLGDNKLIIKQNGSRLSGDVIHSTENLLSRRKNRLKQNSGILSTMANVRNETSSHGNRSSIIAKVINGKYSQTVQSQRETSGELTKSGGGFISDELHAASKRLVKESKIGTTQQYTVEKVRTCQLSGDNIHKAERAVSIFSSTSESVCSEDNQSLPTDWFETCIDYTNTENGENIDNKTKLNSITEYVEEKISEIISSNENCPDEKVTVTLNESIEVKSSTKKETVDRTASYSSRYNQRVESVCTINSCHSILNLNNRNICIDNDANGDICDNAKRSVSGTICNNDTEETTTKDSISINSKKMAGHDTIEFQSEKDMQRNKSQCESMDMSRISQHSSVRSHSGEGRRVSLRVMVAPAISNISLSNNLLNVLSIDDCKISMRYSLHKVNVRVTPQRQDNTQLHLGFINSRKSPLKLDERIHSRVATRTILGTKRISLAVKHTARHQLVGNKKQSKIFVQTDNMHFPRKKRPSSSANIDQSLHNLMHNSARNQQSGYCMSKAGHDVTGVSCDREGPCFRRLRAALRVHMEDVLQSHCARLLTRYKRLAGDDSVGSR